MSQEIEIGLGKKGRLGYALDDVAIVPSRRTRDPEDVSTSWQIDAYEFDVPVIGAPMDSVTSPATAIAMGKMGAVGADCLRKGQTVVDVGIHVNEEGKLCGDVKFAEAEPVVDAITPVPGGVGTVTTSVLVGHVVQAAAKKAGL